jgi:serine protease Do
MFELRLDSPQGFTRHPGFNLGFLIGLGTLLLVLGGAVGFRAAMVGTTSVARDVSQVQQTKPDLWNGFAEVARHVEGAVVNINTEEIIHTTGAPLGNRSGDYLGHDYPLDSFFRQIPRDVRQTSLGSGFVIEQDGYILTNDHVVENASRVKVKLNDGRTTDAMIVGTDAETDLAVLRIRASNLPVLHLAKSDQVHVGDWVLAFGSPFGLEKTMTAGIISAMGSVVGAGPYESYLQTDATINPGNSGGPLVNLRGEVVGISTLIASQTGRFQGVGFAIPSSTAEDVYHQIIRSGKVTRGWLGIHVQEVTPAIAKSFDLGGQRGVLIADVDSGSPAAKGGLQSGDVILSFGDREIHNMHELSSAVAGAKIGSPSRVKVLRNDKTLFLNVSVGERPTDILQSFRSSAASGPGILGMTVESISPDTQRQLHLNSAQGALISDVKIGSAADEAGVRPGDVIREVNHSPVSRAGDVIAVTNGLKYGDTVLLKIERQGQTLFLAFELM